MINAKVVQGNKTTTKLTPQQTVSVSYPIANNSVVVSDVEINPAAAIQKTKVTPQQEFMVTNYQVNSSNIKIEDMTNVVSGNLQDGSLLIYDASTSMWRARNVIESPNTEVNGGFF